MLKLSNSLINARVMSLRTGSPVGVATKMIINPNNLKIEGWYVRDKFNNKQMVLVGGEVRDISSQGIIINDHEVLSEPGELIRLQPIIDIGFELIGKQVVSQSGQKYGKVSDFAVETEALLVKKIYSAQSIIKNFTGGNNSIDRTQIVEITHSRIIIEDPVEKAGAVSTSPSVAN